MVKVGIMICDRNRTCTGNKCFKSIIERDGVFAEYCAREAPRCKQGDNVLQAHREGDARLAPRDTWGTTGGCQLRVPHCSRQDHAREASKAHPTADGACAPDDSERRRPVPIKGSEYTVEVDMIVKAIGQSVVVPANFGVEANRQGRIVINEETMQTSLPGVYAGGDGVYGPSSVIEALRDGRKAAHSIDMSLGGKGLPPPDLEADEFVGRPINIEEIRFQEKVVCRELNSEKRVKGFGEVELGFDEDEALREARRCWKCDWNE